MVQFWIRPFWSPQASAEVPDSDNQLLSMMADRQRPLQCSANEDKLDTGCGVRAEDVGVNAALIGGLKATRLCSAATATQTSDENSVSGTDLDQHFRRSCAVLVTAGRRTAAMDTSGVAGDR